MYEFIEIHSLELSCFWASQMFEVYWLLWNFPKLSKILTSCLEFDREITEICSVHAVKPSKLRGYEMPKPQPTEAEKKREKAIKPKSDFSYFLEQWANTFFCLSSQTLTRKDRWEWFASDEWLRFSGEKFFDWAVECFYEEVSHFKK